MTTEEKAILDDLAKKLEGQVNNCIRKIGFMIEHGFSMEQKAIEYKKDAYTRSWLEVINAIDKIKNLEE